MNRIDTTKPVLDRDIAVELTNDAPMMSIDGTVILLQYTDARSGLDMSSVPNAESYEVTIPEAPLEDGDDDPDTPMTRALSPTGTRVVNPMAVSIDANNVVSLTLAADHRLLNGETDVLVTYTKATFGDDLSGVIQDDAGNDAAEVLLPNQAVLTNRIDSAAPTLTSSEVSADGLSIVLTYADRASADAAAGSGLNPDFVPALNSFTVVITRDGIATQVSPSMVVISDASDPADGVYETVTLTLPVPVRVTTDDDTVTVAYDASAAGTPLQDMAGNQAADAVAGTPAVTGTVVDDLPVLSVANDGETPPVATEPKMSADGLSVVLTFSRLLDEDSVPSTSAFMVTINGLEVPLAGVSVDNVDTSDPLDGTADMGRVTLTLPSYLKVAAQNSPAVKVSYTDLTPGQDDRSGVLQDAVGKRDIASFGPHDVDTRPING
jgi:hypothetical protein